MFQGIVATIDQCRHILNLFLGKVSFAARLSLSRFYVWEMDLCVKHPPLFFPSLSIYLSFYLPLSLFHFSLSFSVSLYFFPSSLSCFTSLFLSYSSLSIFFCFPLSLSSLLFLSLFIYLLFPLWFHLPNL